MKKIKIILSILFSAIMIIAFNACNGNSVKLSIKTEKDIYIVNIGMTFTIPVAKVVDEKGEIKSGYNIIYTVKDPSDNEVDASSGTFNVEIAGDYIIIFSVSSQDSEIEIDSKQIIVRCNENLLAQQALTDVAVSKEGKITFTQTAGVTYSLYIDGEKIDDFPIESGTNIRDYVDNTPKLFGIKKDARDGYKESPLSNTVSVKTNAETVLSISDTILDFDYDSSYTYSLYISGVKIDTSETVTDNFDIMEYLFKGINIAWITVDDGSESSGSVILNSKSNNVYIINHDEIRNSKINSNGTISFTGEQGFNYRLIMPEPLEPIDITMNADISQYLDELPSGENILYIEIIPQAGSADTSYVVEKSIKSASECSVYKYIAPDNLELRNHDIFFITDQGSVDEPDSCSLYLDNVRIGNISSGQNIYNLYTNSGNVLVSVRADSDSDGWRSDLSSTGVSLPGLFKGEVGNPNITSLTAQPGGITVTGKTETLITYSEEISLKEISDNDEYFFEFKVLPVNNVYSFRDIKIFLTDAVDESNTLVISFLNNYVRAGYINSEGEERIWGIEDYLGLLRIFGTTAIYGEMKYGAPMGNRDGRINDEGAQPGGLISLRYDYDTKSFYFRDNRTCTDTLVVSLADLSAYSSYLYYDVNVKDGDGWEGFSAENTNGRVKLKVEFTFVSGTSEGCVQIASIGGNDLSNASEYFSWDNNTSTVDKRIVKYTTSPDLGTDDLGGIAPLLQNKGEINGYLLRTKENHWIRYNEILQFDSLTNTNIVEFSTNSSSAKSDKVFYIRLVDAANPNKVLTFSFFMNSNTHSAGGGAIPGWKYKASNGTETSKSFNNNQGDIAQNFGISNAAGSTIVPMIRYIGNNQFMILDKNTGTDPKLSGLDTLLSSDGFGSSGFYVEFNSGNTGSFAFSIVVISIGGTILV